jgi:parvulin-like peptidyl-prolyl isomerase
MSGMRAKSRFRLTAKPNRKRAIVLALGGLSVIAVCALIRMGSGSESAEATTPGTDARTGNAPAPAAGAQRQSNIVAKVNGQQITREQLGRECLRRYGKDVLETVMNRHLIAIECRKHKVVISKEAVDREIDRIARRFGMPVDQWLLLLESERGIAPQDYRDEIVWPTVALRRLAAAQLEVSEVEIQREFESRFGPKVQVRMITVEDAERARQIRAAATAKPDEFSRLAVKYSKDVNSASAGGLVQPIRRHMGDPKIEQVAFALRPGEISEVFNVGEQYILLKCESHVPARPPGQSQLKQARLLITEAIRDRKLRTVGTQMFRKLQKDARVENILKDPVKRRQMPGVAATINGHQIPVADLQEACLNRHGKEALERTINRMLLEMELAKAGKRVTQTDIDQEIARAAIAAGIVTADGKADIPRWVKLITEEQEITQDAYVADVVYPTVALKKLVENVTVSKEELQKSFEANYGPRVRCRAIIMGNLRRAQEVWDMARRKPTVENFAELAAQYSIDAGSRSLGGVVPPIQRHGGQEALEREAFSLKPGELSGVIQIADKYVILLCEGITKPVVVEMSEVQDLLHEDLLEKKYRLAMARHFEQILAAARITNYLDPDQSRSPSATVRQKSTSRSPQPKRG